MREDLQGFDLEFTGFNCLGDIIEHWEWNTEQAWSCPFKPGCGAKTLSECAGAKQLAKISSASRRLQ